jgi:hypothetical protein
MYHTWGLHHYDHFRDTKGCSTSSRLHHYGPKALLSTTVAWFDANATELHHYDHFRDTKGCSTSSRLHHYGPKALIFHYGQLVRFAN